MPDDVRLDLVHLAIRAGYITMSEACLKRVRNDPGMKGFTEKGIKQILCKFVRDEGGQAEKTEEGDLDWLDKHTRDKWWYSVVAPVPEFPRGIFIKVKLLWDVGDRDDEAFVEIISAHKQVSGRVL